MLKRHSFYVAALFSCAMFMTAGCAMKEAVSKDEGFVPAPTAKQADQPKTGVTPQQNAQATGSRSASLTTPVLDQQTQKAPSTSKLQSGLEKIYFDFDSSNLSDSARSTLTKNAAALMKASTVNIRIEGNCDERGSAEYNLALGERRAKSAQQYLITLGVKADHLSIISYGKEKPAVKGNDEVAMAKNRRDEFVVITK